MLALAIDRELMRVHSMCRIAMFVGLAVFTLIEPSAVRGLGYDRADVPPRRRLHAHLFGVALFVGDPPAGEPEALELRWEAPGGCPGADEARGRVSRFLGRAPGSAGDPRVRAQVRIERRERLFVADIDLESDDGSGQRRFESERCEVVADAAAYMIAAMIDPSVEPPVPEDEGETEGEGDTPGDAEREREGRTEGDGDMAAEPEPPPVAGPTASPSEPAPAPSSRPRARLRGALRLAPALAVGQLPTITAGFVGGAALLLPRLRVELQATHWLARPARLDDRPEVGGDIRLTTGTLRVCPLVVRRPVEVPLCAGFEAGSMHGRGVGLSEPATTRLPWAAFSAAVGLVWMPSRFVGAFLDAALVAPVSRPVFVAENIGTLYQPAPAAFYGVLGVEARFF